MILFYHINYLWGVSQMRYCSFLLSGGKKMEIFQMNGPNEFTLYYSATLGDMLLAVLLTFILLFMVLYFFYSDLKNRRK